MCLINTDLFSSEQQQKFKSKIEEKHTGFS